MSRYSSASDLSTSKTSGGPGIASRWLCMGCHLLKNTLGSRGAGVRKRCAACVESKRK